MVWAGIGLLNRPSRAEGGVGAGGGGGLGLGMFWAGGVWELQVRGCPEQSAQVCTGLDSDAPEPRKPLKRENWAAHVLVGVFSKENGPLL